MPLRCARIRHEWRQVRLPRVERVCVRNCGARGFVSAFAHYRTRTKQNFDHYLKGGLEMEWMKNGLPQTKKGAPIR